MEDPIKRKARQDRANAIYYRKNAAKMIARAQVRYNAFGRDTKAVLLQDVAFYKELNGCIDCGESDSRCLDFDHRDPSEKTKGISEAILNAGWSRAKVFAEIDKCDVRCSNCHRKRTHEQRNRGEL
jgi:hypothetical protein